MSKALRTKIGWFALFAAVALALVGIWTGDGRFAGSGLVSIVLALILWLGVTTL